MNTPGIARLRAHRRLPPFALAVTLALFAPLSLFARPLPKHGIRQPPMGTDAMRRQAVDAPRELIRKVHARLAASNGTLSPATERGLLWWMGSAALNLGDDATLTEAVLRLDSLYHVGHDRLAGAAADYLRAFHRILDGDPSGLSMALRAAGRVQDTDDPRVRAWSGYELCDAYTQAGDAARAQPVCDKALTDARAVGDAWEQADVENDLAWNASALGQHARAITLYRRARARFRSIGATQVAAQVGDNLAHTLILVGQPRQALALSRASLAHEQAAGRESDALLSRANIARAYAALHQPVRAMQVIEAAIRDAEKTSNHGVLPTFYQDDSRFAEAAGKPRHALDSARQAIRWLEIQRRPNLLAAQKILEDRYQARERELRIRDLERENRLKALALKVAQAQAARAANTHRREQLWNAIALVVALALLVISILLYLLLRAQRRHAQALRLLALRDPLTGVDNRRAFMRSVAALLESAERHPGNTHALLLVDLDHFKHVNDLEGHPAGDRVLVQVTREIEQAVEGTGLVSRIGGEEFAVLYRDTGAQAARERAEALCRRIEAMPLPLRAGSAIRTISVSIGVAMLGTGYCTDTESLLRAADRAMYQAKQAGRNRVAMAQAGAPAEED